jgi:hypothetical protein
VDFLTTCRNSSVPGSSDKLQDQRASQQVGVVEASHTGFTGTAKEQLRRRSEQLYGDTAYCKNNSVPLQSSSDVLRTHSTSMNNLSQWLQHGDDDGGNYIDPKLVESVLRCRQMKKGCTEMKIIQHLPLNLPGSIPNPEQMKGFYGSHQSLDSGDFPLPNSVNRIPEFLGKLETEVDCDSGISGDRNSSSSTSSGLSVESSLTSLGSISDLAIGPNPGDRSSSGSTTSNMSFDYLTESIARMTQKLHYPSPALGHSKDEGAKLVLSDHCGSLSRKKNSRLITGEAYQTNLTPKSAGIQHSPTASPDDKCKQMLMDAESQAEASGNLEKLGNLPKAITTCQQAIDILQAAENTVGLSHDMLVHIRMKRNALVLNSRRLQRLISGRPNTMQPIMRTQCKTLDNPIEPFHSHQLSREEIGEILVKEIEGQRSRGSAADVEYCTGLDAAIRQSSVNLRHHKYEEMVKQQLKTFTAKEIDNRANVGQNVKAAGRHCINKPPSDCSDISEWQDIARIPGSSVHVQKQQKQSTGPPKPDLVALDRPLLPETSHLAKNYDDSNSFPDVTNTKITGPSGWNTTCIDSMTTVPQPQVILSSHISERRRSTPSLSTSDVMSLKSVVGTTRKQKKSVTFSDNIELVASANDAEETVDYMTYALGIQQQQQAHFKPAASPVLKHALHSSSSMETFHPLTVDAIQPTTATAQDADRLSADDSDDAELDDASADGRVRCSLCRHKWIELSDTYCPDCSAYMSRLQAPG